MNKHDLLVELAQRVIQAAGKGVLDKQPIAISRAETISGPRAGAVEFYVSHNTPLDAGRLLRVLSANDCSVVRQFLPWDFVGEPCVFMAGRAVRIEAGWPAELAQADITLSQVGQHPKNGSWTVGIDEYGRTVVASVNLDRTPQWLMAGATGSGKTVALRAAICQLAGQDNWLVVVDGKRGALGREMRLQGMVGPVAVEPDAWRSALIWAVKEMQKRYAEHGRGQSLRPLIVVVDEVQEIIDDPVIVEALRRLVTLGRDARVHCLLATQHPLVKALGGPTVTRNLVGRIALRVTDFEASRVALGSSAPRADMLLGKGDCFVAVPGWTHRVQVAYAEPGDFEDVAGALLFDNWPEAGAEDLGIAPASPGRPSPWPGPEEMAQALVAGAEGRGRPWLQEALRDNRGKAPGSNRADQLLGLARKTLDILSMQGWSLCPVQN